MVEEYLENIDLWFQQKPNDQILVQELCIYALLESKHTENVKMTGQLNRNIHKMLKIMIIIV